MKKIFFLFFFASLFFVFPAKAQEDLPIVYFFYGDGCPHCAKEEEFLQKLQEQNPDLEIKNFEVWNNRQNAKLLQEVGNKLDAKITGVPFTVVGDLYMSGYPGDQIGGEQLIAMISHCTTEVCLDVVGNILNENKTDNINKDPDLQDKKFSLPILGEINPRNVSLPLVAIVLGVLDGFNPCAMWALIFLISLLLGMENKKRMWILGSSFIAASAFVYFLFMAAWLNLILFIGFVIWVRILIGGIALSGGAYSLKEFFKNKEGACKVGDEEKKKKVFERLKNIVKKKNFIFALVGIILLAFAVNLVELICSAGLPAVFTQILAINELSTFGYYAYILLYIFFFMIDDLFVFFVAMITLQITGVTTKYTRFARLIGGIVMVMIGVLLLFRPEWLMFG